MTTARRVEKLEAQVARLQRRRRVEKLEAQVASLQRRLAARTDQLILVLTQMDELKRAIDEAGLEVHPAPVNAPAKT